VYNNALNVQTPYWSSVASAKRCNCNRITSSAQKEGTIIYHLLYKEATLDREVKWTNWPERPTNNGGKKKIHTAYAGVKFVVYLP
jgi:hypothetical protein